MKALRGAITVAANTSEAIAEATRSLLLELASRNELATADIVSIFFTLTPDLNADFPAKTARAIGWDVPMLDMQEIAVPGAVPLCLRVLIHVNRDGQPKHVYLGDARALRPDLEQEA